MKVKIFVLFCLVILSLPLEKANATDQTEEKQTDSPEEKLVKEIIDDHKTDITSESTESGVPRAVIIAMIAVESSNNPKAVSHARASGLMQTKPDANKATGVKCNRSRPACQIKEGTRYIQYLVEKEHIPKWSRVFLAYNEGPKGSKKFKTSKQVLSHNHVIKCVSYLKIAMEVLHDKTPLL